MKKNLVKEQMTAANPCSPSFEIAPDRALVDEQVSIRLHGLGPRQRVIVRASAKDDLNRLWESHAEFKANQRGVAAVSEQKPLSGTYREASASGLLWSMALAPDEQPVSPFAKETLAPTVVTFTAEVDGTAVAGATLALEFVSSDVTRMPLREHGLAGTYFRPAGNGPFPAVMVIGGSGGGLQEHRAALLASRGYCTLALAYFAFEQLPPHLVNIPLEYFETALGWLREQEEVSADRIAVMGTSRGGELALLLGATFPQIKAVVGHAPSAVVWGGFNGSDRQAVEPSWVYRGTPAPFMRGLTQEESARLSWQEPIRLTPGFQLRLDDAAEIEKAAIAVERINGAVLLISGQDDRMWPSSLMSQLVMRRLVEHKHPYLDKHLSYQGVGHQMPLPSLPTTVNQAPHAIAGMVFAYGGTAREVAMAATDSWLQIQTFLKQRLAL